MTLEKRVGDWRDRFRSAPGAGILRSIYARYLNFCFGKKGLPWSINGQPFRILPDYRWRLARDYDAPVAAVLAGKITPGDCVLDIGANAGVYALQFARWVGPSGRVFAFEPNPHTQVVLRKHIELNQFAEIVSVVPAAVGSSATRVSFTYQGTDGMSRVGSANPLLAAGGTVHAIEVEQTTIDAFCAAEESVPNLIFLDVEGHEIAALAGAERLVESIGPRLQIAVELHPSAWPNADSSRESLTQWLSRHRRRPIKVDGTTSTLLEHETVFLEPH